MTPTTATSTLLRVTTVRGVSADVRVYGQAVQSDQRSNAPIVFFHGSTGLFETEPMLELLAADRVVYAPVLPGYGPEAEDSGETLLDDMLEVTLHGWDLVHAIAAATGNTHAIHLVGHSMGAMIAAEMAAVSPTELAGLTLISPLGLWNDKAPIPDMFSMLPFEFPGALFADTELGTRLLSGGSDFDNSLAIEGFQVRNSRRLGFAGKLLFPIPNRRLSKRTYRITAPTTIVWGNADAMTPPSSYAALWEASIPGSSTVTIDGAAHCVHVERPKECAQAVLR